jgi:hypothetical protein
MRILPLVLISLLLLACGAGCLTSGGGSSEGITQTSGSLTVTLVEPADGAVVHTDTVVVKGEAPPETVVTVNDDILIVESDGRFESEQLLGEGSNVIEVVASDLEGNEVIIEITVTYEPQ